MTPPGRTDRPPTRTPLTVQLTRARHCPNMRPMRLPGCITLMIVTLIAFAPSLHAAPPPEIRVLVAGSLTVIDIHGEPMHTSTDARTHSMELGSPVRITAGPKGLTLDGRMLGQTITITNRERLYHIGQRTFRGMLTLRWKEHGKLDVVNTLPLEEYLVGLVGSEIRADWPTESVKTQIVAARSYALARMRAAHAAHQPYDVTGTTLSQVYHGAHLDDPRSVAAAKATRGEALYRSGHLFRAWYHSCCGGQTEHAHNVWAGESGPPTATGNWCARSPKFNWQYEIDTTTFAQKMTAAGFPLTNVLSVATTTLADSPRVEHLLVTDAGGMQMIPATKLRATLSYREFQSTWFEVKLSGKKLLFTGRGYGHGVGMCQWGAKAMAEAGHTYREILANYYPDAEVRKAY